MTISIAKTNNYTVSQNIQGKGKEKTNRTKETIGAYLGACAGIAPASLLISPKCIKLMKRYNEQLNENEITDIKEAAKKIIEEKGLVQKGVKLSDFSEISVQSLNNISPILSNTITSAQNGDNAFFGGLKGPLGAKGQFANEICCNMKKLPMAVFHEIGHAFNANKSGFWKIMQKMRRPASMLTAALVCYSMFSKSEETNNENQDKNNEPTKGQKVKKFINDNIGKLTFLSMVPILAEEAMASIRGSSYVKEYLNKDLAKQVSKMQKVTYITYASTAVFYGLSAYLAKKAKNMVKNKLETDNSLQTPQK